MGILILLTVVCFCSLIGCTNQSGSADDQRFDFSGFETLDPDTLEAFFLERNTTPMFPLPNDLRLESTEERQPEGWEASHEALTTIVWKFEALPEAWEAENFNAETFAVIYIFPTVEKAVAAWDNGNSHLPSAFVSINVTRLDGPYQDEQSNGYPSRLTTGSTIDSRVPKPCGFSDAAAVKNNVIIHIRAFTCDTQYGADALAAVEILYKLERDAGHSLDGWP